MSGGADGVIRFAIAELGYLEKASNADLDSKTANAGSSNYNKYARDIWPGLQAQPWCDIFVSWCGMRAGELAAVGKYAYCPSHVNWFKNQGRWFARGVKTPQAGDIIFFQSGGVACHVGIVESVSGGYVHTIEGNASGASGLTPNGGGVVRKSYALTSSYIMGYGRPAYQGTAEQAADETVREEEFAVAKTYRNGSTAEPVYAETTCKTRTGWLDPNEVCECLGIDNGRYLVRYYITGTQTKKVGYVKFAGGVK